MDKTTNNQNHPEKIGHIAETFKYAWGWDGKKYYVTEGVCESYVTMIHLTRSEAKTLFLGMICWFAPCWSDPAEISPMIREARKLKLEGQDMELFYMERLMEMKGHTFPS